MASVFQKTIEEIPQAGLQPLEKDVLLKRNVIEWLDLTRELIAAESVQIDQVLERVSGPRDTRFSVRHRTARLA